MANDLHISEGTVRASHILRIIATDYSPKADDHLNIVPASDGTLYCAVKTGYDKAGFPAMALLVRRPNNTWDNLYPVTSSKEGNRPCVVLNETAGKVKVMYSTHNINLDGTRSGDIVYRESSTSAISFGPPVTLMSGAGNFNLEYTTSAWYYMMAREEGSGCSRTVGQKPACAISFLLMVRICPQGFIIYKVQAGRKIQLLKLLNYSYLFSYSLSPFIP